MKSSAIAFVLLGAVFNHSASAQSCALKPDGSQFYLSSPRCDASAPCLPGRALALSLVKRTTCYPWYAPCPGYSIQSCDTIQWSFGDGRKATATGNPSISHAWSAPGLYSIDATVTNPNGSGTVSTGVLIAYEPVAFVSFSKSRYTAGERAGSITITLLRTGDTTRRLTVGYRTGYAIGTVDRNLETVAGSVTFEPGDTSKSFSVPVIDDAVYNGDSYHSVYVECSTGEAILPDLVWGHAEIQIVEDEPAPTATVSSNVSVIEGNSGSTRLEIPVTLSRTFAEPVDFWWTIWEETAKRGVDWAAPDGFVMSGPLTIPAGASRGTIAVDILGDTSVESDETFRIEFFRSGTVAVLVVGAPIHVTILNDDIALSPQSLLIPRGQTDRLSLATAAGPTSRIARLASTDASVVEVPATITIPPATTSAGIPIKARNPGTADVRATLDGASMTAIAHVTVYEPQVVTFEETAVQLRTGRSTTATLRVDPPPASPLTATVTTSTPSVIRILHSITVPTSGRVTFTIDGLTPGNTSIVATLADAPGQPSASLRVTIIDSAAMNRRRSVRQ